MRIFTILLAFICCLSSPALAGEMVLGTIFELQDSQAPTAQEALNGALLAVKKINESGKHSKIRLEVESISGETTGVLKGVDKLVKSKGIIAATGIISENTALTAAPAFQAANLPFLCTGAQDDSLSHIGMNIFSLAVPDIRTGQLLAEFATGTMLVNNIMLVRSDLSDSTARQADSFARRFKQNGGNIMAEMRITEPDPDLSFVSEKLKDLIPPKNTNSTVVNDPVEASDFVDSAVGLDIQKRATEPAKPQVEGVIVFAPAGIAAKLLARLKEDQLTYPVLGGMTFDSVSMQQSMKDYPATVYYASQASMEREAPLVRSFVESYKGLFGHAPQTGYAALGFDSVMLLASAGAKRTSSAGIRDVLPETKHFEGVCGKISFLGRSASKPLYIIQRQNGQKSLATVLD
ncbi:ABC transporter substrate-binding protein [Desulfovibrio sp. JC010]|uniref:ABC transporter substrate-binding protein n=1 Tax=Desulfovibrio sp. JC010 TaxID=2593641 RepID=UPI0013D70903|nr:ABC transporter substrate-binding protein [Desulfovibrio sp. JC010]NDV26935.1 ABC transporter substrate-binding protein [Desulfovibrio sp. JC010]